MSGDHRSLAVVLFSLLVALTLAVTAWAGRPRRVTTEESYTGGRLFSPMENGFASPAAVCRPPPSSASAA
ncbi:hypothetical protein G3I34_07150 [Streptomyces sp. SID8014]|uniref:hypothetical protein n=1 Tax=Streptomyces sp. SID8014 TaxID=2706097 RepID=UPI0013BDD484|nr:hypothetical protein [Streptomyces sp. SID8014]NEC12072.1 hypothetical protein [Streptomyces sp. SID8014]